VAAVVGSVGRGGVGYYSREKIRYLWSSITTLRSSQLRSASRLDIESTPMGGGRAMGGGYASRRN